MVGLKQRYSKWKLIWTLNILRFPSFQSPLVLPDDIKTRYRNNLVAWLDAHRDNPLIHDHEFRHLERLIDYLDVIKTPHSNTHDTPRLLNDFKQFYTQYDQRRGKDFVKTFPELAEWYQTL
jgi:hypothetical protein